MLESLQNYLQSGEGQYLVSGLIANTLRTMKSSYLSYKIGLLSTLCISKQKQIHIYYTYCNKEEKYVNSISPFGCIASVHSGQVILTRDSHISIRKYC